MTCNSLTTDLTDINTFENDSQCLLNSLSKLVPAILYHFNNNIGSNDIMTAVAKELQKFGKLGVMRIVNEVLNNHSLLAEYASKCYLHNNGFYRINLATDSNFTIRLHIWLMHTSSMETLHDHRWHIASAIIDGYLKSEIWQDSASPHANYFDEYMYIDKYTDPILLGQSKVEFVQQAIHEAGDCYVLNTGVLHRIISNGEKLTATLICHSANAKKCSRNIILNNQVPDVKPHYLTPEAFEILLKRYLQLSTSKREI